MLNDPIKYPCEVRCYRLVEHPGQPPCPEDDPVSKVIATSREELDAAKIDMMKEHPDGWCVETPIS